MERSKTSANATELSGLKLYYYSLFHTEPGNELGPQLVGVLALRVRNSFDGEIRWCKCMDRFFGDSTILQ